MRSAPVGFGVVGCGWVGRDFVVPAILSASNARLAALGDGDPEALSRIETDAPRHLDLDAMLRDPDVEAVYIALPNHLHAEATLRCAAAGKHVLCEKPMAPRAVDAQAMVRACARAGVRYATAFDQRFHPAHRAIRRLLAEGGLGTVSQIRILYACWLGPDWSSDNWRIDAERAGGGATIDLAPHGVDLVQTLTGQPFVDVRALLQRRVHDYPVDDGGHLIGRLADDTLVTLNVAYNTPETYPRRRLEVIGTRAMLVASETMGQAPGGRVEIIDAASGAARALDFDPAASPFTVQVEAFAAAIRGAAWPFRPECDAANVALLENALLEEGACRAT